ncbi:hypothetical protein DICVIV_12453 [Dictyocaulus viviparus]|uniref:Hflx-type G domain-containing protein n=1 Tax=Dictyocaulus viviparus TaxID=29172 RepID=A0A0D8XGT3_DICVI|nr:hypothetical protein DICVIV_12453 [Dictyocaulus viviparus]
MISSVKRSYGGGESFISVCQLQYHETLRALCNEAPSLRDSRNRFQSGSDVFIQVNDQLHDKNLERIVNDFSVVGRFDITPELVDFGVRLRDLTNEFSTMTARQPNETLWKEIFYKTTSNQAITWYYITSMCQFSIGYLPFYSLLVNFYILIFRNTYRIRFYCIVAVYGCDNITSTYYTSFLMGSLDIDRTVIACYSFYSPYSIWRMSEPHSAKEADYMQQFHDTCISGNNEILGSQQLISQPEINFEYQSQPHVSSYAMSVASPYISSQPIVQNSAVTTAQELSLQNTPTYKTSQLVPPVPLNCGDEPMLIDYGINAKNCTAPDIGPELDITTAHCTLAEVGDSESAERSQLSSTSFSYESGAHKRKTTVPHRREELVAHTAQTLIVPNGVLVELDANGVANNASVFPFCEDNEELSEFATNMCDSYSLNDTHENELVQEETQEMFSEPIHLRLRVDQADNLQFSEPYSVKSRSLDEGEIISDESLHVEKSQKPASSVPTETKPEQPDTTLRREKPIALRNELRRSSLDSGKEKRSEKKVADRLKEFNRNPPRIDVRTKKSTTDRAEIHDAVIHEARNVPRVSPTCVGGGRLSRGSGRCFASLFDEVCSGPSSRESSPHREKVNKKEEERRRREKEMERERQREKERLKRQRRDRDTRHDKERCSRTSPNRKTAETKALRREEEEKVEIREKERRRDYASDDRETTKSGDEIDDEVMNSCVDSPTSDAQHTARSNSDIDIANKRELQAQEDKIHFRKLENKKNVEPLCKSAVQENEDNVSFAENDERLRKTSKEEARAGKNVSEVKKSFIPSTTARRREETKKVAVKPLEPGMMMNDTSVLDRINKEMESLTSRNRPTCTRSPEGSSCAKNTCSSKKSFVISSGLSTTSLNQLVFSKAHSSRLGMFLEKVSDKHKKLMDRENDQALASPEDNERNGVSTNVSQFPKQQQQRFAPQKRPLPASSLDSYLGSPTQVSDKILCLFKNSPDNRDMEATSSRSLGKKSKIDLSKMPDIIERLYGGKNCDTATVYILCSMKRQLVFPLHSAQRSLRLFSNSSIDVRYDPILDAVENDDFVAVGNKVDRWKCKRLSSSHDFLVVHPKVRWGSSSASRLKDPRRQLDEAIALVNTLPSFRVVESAIFGVDYNTKRKTVWGSGQIDALITIKEQARVTALMVNVDMLSPLQQHELFQIFRIPIYDRYNIVLSIFKQYANTLEAHLQIKLAEIPYIRHRLHYVNRFRANPAVLHIERHSEYCKVDEFEVLRMQEQRLRKKLKQLIEKDVEKATEKAQNAMMVAVVGYTNAGKTSLVKCLTGAMTLLPENRLFATLDTTRHVAR